MGKKTRQARERLKAGNFKSPSPQEIIDAMTPAGAWTAKQLAEWGVPWPPPKGWRHNLEMSWRAEQKPKPLKPDYKDPFAPDRNRNAMIRCLHCGQQYREGEAKFEYRPKFSTMIDELCGDSYGLWWCRNSNCDGAGVGFDLIPLDKINQPEVAA